MELKIKAVSPKMGREIPLPQYKTAGAAAMDLCACMEEDVTLAPGQRIGIPTGIAIALPSPDYAALVFVRSGMKNHIRPVCSEDLPHPPPVPYRSDLHFQIEPPTILVQQFLLNIIGVILIDIHDHQLFGIVLDNLSAQL